MMRNINFKLNQDIHSFNRELFVNQIYFRIFFSFTWTCKVIITSFMYYTIALLTLKTLITKTPENNLDELNFLILKILPKKIRTYRTKCWCFKYFWNKFMTIMFINLLSTFSITIPNLICTYISNCST
jgi:hypothetical protein